MSESMGGIIPECPGDFVGIRTLRKRIPLRCIAGASDRRSQGPAGFDRSYLPGVPTGLAPAAISRRPTCCDGNLLLLKKQELGSILDRGPWLSQQSEEALM